MNNRFPQTFPEYMHMLKRSKGLFLVPFVSVLLLVAAAYPFLPKYYKASALVLINEDKLVEPFVAGKDGPSVRDNSVEKKIKTLIFEVAGRSNLRAIVGKVGLAKNIRNDEDLKDLIVSMAKRIRINPLPGKMIEISYIDRDPVAAKNVTNEVADSLVSIDGAERQAEAKSAITFIENQLRVYKDKIQSSEQTMFASKTSTDLADALKRRSLALDQVNQLERTLPASNRPDNPGILRLEADLSDARAKQQELLLHAREDSPMAQELSAKINGLESILSLEKENHPTSVSATDNPNYLSAFRELKAANLDIEALRKSKPGVRAAAASPASAEDVTSQERDKKVNEDIYQALLKAMENAQITQRLGAYDPNGTFRVMDAAETPEEPYIPTPLQVCAGALLLAVATGLGFVFLREYRDTSFRGVSDAKEYLSMPLLGTIPKFVPARNGVAHRAGSPRIAAKNGDVSQQIVVFHRPQSLPSEYFRILRTQLLALTAKRPMKSLLVSSAIAGEGKTTTSINMATSMASELEQRVLLIDCDIRQGSIGKNLGLAQKRGLFDYLSGTCDLESILKATRIGGLTVITAGEPVAYPAKLLSSDRMTDLMSQLRARYDTIIMDAPPILPLADVPILAGYADGVLLVVEAGKTPRRYVAHAQAILEKTQKANMLGYVLTRAEDDLPSEYMSEYFADN